MARRTIAGRALIAAIFGCVASASLVSAQDASEVAPEEEATTSEPAVAEEQYFEGSRPDFDTLDELVHRAITTSPGLRANHQKIAAAEAQLDEATFSPFFQITATGAVTVAPQQSGSPIFSRDSQLPLDNPWSPIVRVGVEGAIPIWTFGKLGAARDAARAGLDGARLDRVRVTTRLRYDVRRAYYALQLALDVQQMIGEGQGKLEQAVQKIEEALERGDSDVTESDRLRLSSAIAEVEARRSEAVRIEASARDALSMLTGVSELSVSDCPSAPLQMELEPVEHYLRLAAHSRPESRQLDAGLAARQAGVDAAFARFFPDLALTLAASQSYGPGITNQTNPFIPDPANYSSLGAGVVARWSMDFVGNSFRHDRARAELEDTRAQAELARNGIALEVRTTYREVEDAKRREAAWGRGHRDSRAWFIAASQAYQVGAAEPRELVDAVRAYFTARASHLQAILDHNSAIAKLALVTGEPLLGAGAWEVGCE